MEQNRKFKGIWIPREIWENQELSILEKIFLVEIDSLEEEERGCFASNSYFAKFFQLSNSRVSQIINGLINKEYLYANYKYEGKEIIERNLKINKAVFNKLNTYLENSTKGIKFSKGGYLENAKDNNININNIYSANEIAQDTSLEEKVDQREIDFEKLWQIYPSKKGKSKAFSSYCSWLKGKKYMNKTIKLTNTQMWYAIKKYVNECEQSKRFFQNGSTFFNNTIVEYVSSDD